MNNLHFYINSSHCPVPDNKKENVTFYFGKALINLIIIMRGGGDSVELIDWSMFDLERNPYDTFRFESGCFSGPVHKARWMGKLLILFIEYYKQWNTTIFVTFLDASKAFDRIDHWLLFKKLIDKHVPLFIIKLLVCWYSTQKMHIRWGNTVNTSFLISYGVKQGGIISPILFNLYMDQLSEKLNASNIGGDIGGSWLTIYVMQMIFV